MESNNQNSQEIDLSYLSKKTASFFDNLGYSLFIFFKFIIKNIVVISLIIVVGCVGGFFLDKQNSENYKHEIIVIPNFNSTSYLYNKVATTKYDNNPITSVEIKPIVDVYQFINEGYNNLEIAKYLSENNIQLTKYEPKSDVEKFYKYHLMTVYTNKKDENGIVIKNFLEGLNQDNYFKERQKIEILNTDRELTELDSSINDLNNILQKLGSSTEKTGELNIEMYSEINNLFNAKKSLLNDYNRLEVSKIEQSKIIYNASVFSNIKNKSMSRIFLMPVILLVVFFVGAFLKKLHQKYKNREHVS